MNIRRLAAALLLAVVGGCASKGVKVEPPPLPKLIVKKIAILPVQEVRKFDMENKNFAARFLFPVVGSVIAGNNKEAQASFTEKMLAQKMSYGKSLTAYLSQALQAGGYQVVLLDSIPRPAEEPEDIDFDNIKTDADAILHVYIDEIGLISPNSSDDYLPRLNVYANLRSTRRDEEFYDEKLCYGVDGREGKAWAVAADPAFAYPSYASVTAKIPEVAARFEAATQAVGAHLVTQLKLALQ